VVDALKRIGRYDDTAIFFSSDNGPSTESRNWLDGREDLYYGGSAGILRGHKASLFDGGIREPALLSYPAQLPAGRVCDAIGMMIDVVPTFLELADVAAPPGHLIDGRSILPTLMEGKPSPHEQVFWEYAGQQAVRQGPWKLVLDGKLDFSRPAADRVFLSNLDLDPGERINIRSYAVEGLCANPITIGLE
ncbi:MAG: sulfatase-like hydrolase/transferase, partial [Actinomycetota bacterium]|nr:sulfatase-like hydrolase/transferase [Actinomycetota bacterium]